jgi:hypothetical protein
MAIIGNTDKAQFDNFVQLSMATCNQIIFEDRLSLKILFLGVIILCSFNISQVTNGQEEANTTDTESISPDGDVDLEVPQGHIVDDDVDLEVPQGHIVDDDVDLEVPQGHIVDDGDNMGRITQVDPQEVFELVPDAKISMDLETESPVVGTPFNLFGKIENPPKYPRVFMSWGDDKIVPTINNFTKDGKWRVEHTYDEPGTYIIYAYFKSCDENKTCDDAELEVTVLPKEDGGVGPSITIDNTYPDRPLANDILTVDGTIKNPLSNSFSIDWGDNSDPDEHSIPSDAENKWTAQHSYAESGSYTITATLEGCVEPSPCEATTPIEVQQSTSSQPFITIDNTDPYDPLVNNALLVEGRIFNSQSNIFTIEWGDDTDSKDLTADNDGKWSIEHTYDEQGVYTVTATLIDDNCDDQSDCVDTEIIKVQPQPTEGTTSKPSIRIDTINPDNPIVNNEVSIEGSASKAPSKSLTIDWGDNTEDYTGITTGDDGKWFANHVYRTEGEFIVRAVLNGCEFSESCIDSQTFMIGAPPPQPLPLYFPEWIVILIGIVIAGAVISHILKKSKHSSRKIGDGHIRPHVPTIEVVGGVEK